MRRLQALRAAWVASGLSYVPVWCGSIGGVRGLRISVDAPRARVIIGMDVSIAKLCCDRFGCPCCLRGLCRGPLCLHYSARLLSLVELSLLLRNHWGRQLRSRSGRDFLGLVQERCRRHVAMGLRLRREVVHTLASGTREVHELDEGGGLPIHGGRGWRWRTSIRTCMR